MENKTPAQLAKDYAVEHGFVITPVGRRYTVTYPDAQYDTHVADVGGYPAALNAMRKYVEARQSCEGAGNDPWAHDGAIHTEPRIGGALTDGCTDAQVAEGIQAQYERNNQRAINLFSIGISFNPRDVENGEIKRADVRTNGDVPDAVLLAARVLNDREDPFGVTLQTEYKRLFLHNPNEFIRLVQLARGRTLDGLAHAAEGTKRMPGQSDHEYRNLLLYGHVDGIAAAVATINLKVAPSIAYGSRLDEMARLPVRKRRAPRHTHSVEWRYKGGKIHSQPYPSHAEALKAVRQMMCNKRMRPDYVNIVPVGVTA
jgi:hypothetical protein